MMRIGQSIDIHQLVEGRKLILGGVEIPFELGLKGHSDADVLLHAIIESIIGAMGLGDIGKHFLIQILSIKVFLQWFFYNIHMNSWNKRDMRLGILIV